MKNMILVWRNKWWLWVMLPGVGLRILMVLRSDFPLNDGGMFYSVIQDVLSANFHMPEFLSYNLANIPFAYPPLAFYLAAGLNKFLGVSVLDILHYLPGFFSILTVPAFYRLAKKIWEKEEAAAVSTLFYSLAPRSFEWLIMGGGLTRSLGMLLAILALGNLYDVYLDKNKNWVIAGILFGLTGLSHPEMGLFLLISSLIFWSFRGRNKEGLLNTIRVAGISMVIILPWVLGVLYQHGAQVFVNALTAGASPVYTVILILGFSLTGELGLAFINMLGFLGMADLIMRQKLFLPMWLLAVILIDPRAAQTESMVILALMAGWFWIKYVKSGMGNKLLLGFMCVYIIGLNLVALKSSSNELGFVAVKDLAAMEWVKKNTENTAKFLVLTPRMGQYWPVDREVEWFFPLTDRVAVNTVQGYEWVEKKEFLKRTLANLKLKDGGYWTSQDEIWEKHFGSYNYIYLTNSSFSEVTYVAYVDKIINSVKEKGNYVEVYKDTGVEIFRRK